MPGYVATDHFAMTAAEFSVQSSSTRETREYAMAMAADGDVACESSAFNVTTEYSADYKHCGTNNTLLVDAASVVTSPTGGIFAKFGAVADSKLITGIELSFDNKSLPALSITGHNHTNNAHAGTFERQFDVSGCIPAAQGYGVPTLGTGDYAITIAATSAFTGATYSIACEHMDTEDEGGDHFNGQNRTCRVDVTVEGIGVQGDVTLGANWIEDDNEDGDSNEGTDTFSVAAHLYVDAI